MSLGSFKLFVYIGYKMKLMFLNMMEKLLVLEGET